MVDIFTSEQMDELWAKMDQKDKDTLLHETVWADRAGEWRVLKRSMRFRRWISSRKRALP